MQIRQLMQLKHDRNYYWGLALLVVSCFSLVWALWRDAFRPEVFLAGFLAFSWGYALLWRHDIDAQLASLRDEVMELRHQRDKENERLATAGWDQELHEAAPASPEDGTPAAPGGGDELLITDF